MQGKEKRIDVYKLEGGGGFYFCVHWNVKRWHDWFGFAHILIAVLIFIRNLHVVLTVFCFNITFLLLILNLSELFKKLTKILREKVNFFNVLPKVYYHFESANRVDFRSVWLAFLYKQNMAMEVDPFSSILFSSENVICVFSAWENWARLPADWNAIVMPRTREVIHHACYPEHVNSENTHMINCYLHFKLLDSVRVSMPSLTETETHF